MLIFIFLKLLGSLALFLYGVNILNKGARSCFAESYVAVNLWMSRRGRKFHPSHVSFLSKIVEIGATMSLWLLAVLGFGLDAGLYIFPLFILAYPLYHSENVLREEFGRFLFGLAFLFLSLSVFHHGLQELPRLPDMPWAASSVWGILLWTAAGLALSAFIRSMTLVSVVALGLCAAGLSDVYAGAALLAGSGVGALIPAYMSPLSHEKVLGKLTQIRLVRRAMGLVWLLFVFRPFVYGCEMLTGWLFPGAPAGMSSVYTLAVFLTCHRLCNVVLLQVLILPLARVYQRWLQAKLDKADAAAHVSDVLSADSPSDSLQTTCEGVRSVADSVCELFDELKAWLANLGEPKSSGFKNRLRRKLRDGSHIHALILRGLDVAESGGRPDMDTDAVQEARREVDALGDALGCCGRMADLLARLHTKRSLTSKQREHLAVMFQFAGEALLRMRVVLGEEGADADATLSFGIEQEMDNFRDQLLAQDAMDRRDPAYDSDLGELYTSLISECEAFGNCVVRVVEARSGVKRPA